MGTDNLYHKRKKKSIQDLSRKKAKLGPYDRILIVCEGKKTEPNYFNGLKDNLRVHNANVEIFGESNPSPTSVFSFALKQYKKYKKEGLPFDKVFCVFDKNNHQDYKQVLKKINNFTPKKIFYATTSVPAFEYYLLLHYEYRTKPYTSAEVLSDLQQHIPNYEKGNKDIFFNVRNHLEVAKENASKSLKEAKQNDTDNPSTRVHELVECMEGLRRDRQRRTG